MLLTPWRSQSRECNRVRRALLALVAIAQWGSVASAQAHDYWIEPATFRPAPNTTVPLRLYVGEHLKGESQIYFPEIFERYVGVGPSGEQAIGGTPGDDPAGMLKVRDAGVHVIGYRSTKSSVRFDDLAEFERYLNIEGLEQHREQAAKVFKRKGTVLEYYSRCAKALVSTNPPAPNQPADRILGFPLELIARNDPYALRAGGELGVQLLYQGNPLAGNLVIAFNRDRPKEKIRARTDADGRVTLKLTRAGVWLVTSVHLKPAGLFSRADWESLWASLTFEVP
ncbi:MAG: DUF4198 domain-containing protein [Pseudomonadota bacterium]|nr:MAG: DUF4198 domain-containing protein [Pseudomonadota bacterium]